MNDLRARYLSYDSIAFYVSPSLTTIKSIYNFLIHLIASLSSYTVMNSTEQIRIRQYKMWVRTFFYCQLQDLIAEMKLRKLIVLFVIFPLLMVILGYVPKLSIFNPEIIKHFHFTSTSVLFLEFLKVISKLEPIINRIYHSVIVHPWLKSTEFISLVESVDHSRFPQHLYYNYF